MKVIDLLNKRSNGEEVPKKIKIRENVYCYEDNEYKRYIGFGWFFLLGDLQAQIIFLDDEIEIIEESKKIKKLDGILKIDDLEPPYNFNTEKIWKNIIIQQNKINEIIDYINKGDSNE